MLRAWGVEKLVRGRDEPLNPAVKDSEARALMGKSRACAVGEEETSPHGIEICADMICCLWSLQIVKS
jgi:hypothetical protein